MGEFCNILCVCLSMFFCNWLLNYQFALYGLKVLEYLGTIKRVNQLGQYVTHDPMCELFPTEVACTLRYGATTGALDRSNFLCILGNNLSTRSTSSSSGSGGHSCFSSLPLVLFTEPQ